MKIIGSSIKDALCVLIVFLMLVVTAPLDIHAKVSGKKRQNKTKHEVELPFVVIVCSYNNAFWIERCLSSILNQKYSNFRVVCIDDASTDETLEIIERYIRQHNLQSKVTVVKNSVRQRKLYNIYNAFHTCQDHEYIVQVDGDDHLAHRNVFRLMNKIFTLKKPWFSYGNYRDAVGRKSLCGRVASHIQKNGLYRKYPWMTSHLKVFVGWLAKMIKLENLLTQKIPGWEGHYYPAANDLATVYPMLDMARERIYFNPKVVYVYNRSNPDSSFSSNALLQQACGKEVKGLPVYERLSAPVLNRLESYRNARADCLIISHSLPGLERFLISMNDKVKHIDTMVIIYTAQKNDAGVIDVLKNKFKNIIFYDACISLDATRLSKILRSTKSNHILCVHDALSLTLPIDCRQWIFELERTFAYACYGFLRCTTFQQHNIPFQHIQNKLFAWKFLCDQKGAIKPNSFDMVLYRKNDIIDFLQHNKPRTLDDFERNWSSNKLDMNKVGLFFDNNQ